MSNVTFCVSVAALPPTNAQHLRGASSSRRRSCSAEGNCTDEYIVAAAAGAASDDDSDGDDGGDDVGADLGRRVPQHRPLAHVSQTGTSVRHCPQKWLKPHILSR